MAADGYDRESVRAAFDSFYRHLAQLDSTLRALEAVDVFRDQAGDLRRELRALKAAGWAQHRADGYARARISPGLPEWLPRVAVEAVFLVVVAVVVAVAGFDRVSILLVMALAWVIVGVVEWAASQDRFARRAGAAPARVRDGRPPALGGSSSEPAARDAERWQPPPVDAAVDDARTLVPARVRPPRRVVWRSRVVVVGLVTIALPAGIAPAALFFVGRDGRPTAAPAPVARHSPRPRAVGPEAIGRPKRETAPPRTDAVVRASRGDSWVELRANSPDGKELYAGMLVHGRFVHTRSERVWLRLGAASNVDVRVNGKHVGPLFGTVAVLLAPGGVATS